jgi:hypothetical protein
MQTISQHPLEESAVTIERSFRESALPRIDTPVETMARMDPPRT